MTELIVKAQLERNPHPGFHSPAKRLSWLVGTRLAGSATAAAGPKPATGGRIPPAGDGLSFFRMRIRKPAEKKKENDNWGEIIETDGKGGKKSPR